MYKCCNLHFLNHVTTFESHHSKLHPPVNCPHMNSTQPNQLPYMCTVVLQSPDPDPAEQRPNVTQISFSLSNTVYLSSSALTALIRKRILRYARTNVHTQAKPQRLSREYSCKSIDFIRFQIPIYSSRSSSSNSH